MSAALSPLLQSIHDSAPGELVRDVFWVFPTLETLHFIGMAMLFGVVVVIDLRVIGVLRGPSVAELHRFLPMAFIGFVINLASGLLCFAADPAAYAFNAAFRFKMLCILLAGLNALWFRYNDPSKTPALVASVLSILLWLAVIAGGRIIPYVSGAR